jgi:hypothetical protein
MGETVVKYSADGKLFTEDGRPVEVIEKKGGKLPRPVIHALGRVEQILACADRLMDRCDPPVRG